MIESVRKALDILSFVAARDEQPVSLSGIAEGVGIPAATCAHLVETLCAANYLEKVSRREGYIMGPQMHINTTQRLYRHRLIEIASPVMMRLCRDLQESVSLSTMSGGRLFVVYTVNYREEHISRIKTLRGQMLGSASGRVFLAHMSEQELADALAACAQEGESAGPDICRQLEDIREKQVCLVRRVRGDNSAISCPVYRRGSLIAAMGTYLPDERMTGEHMNRCVRLCRDAAARLSARLDEENDI